METEPYASRTEPEALIPNRIIRLSPDLARAIGEFQAALRRLGIESAVRYPANSTLIEVLVDGR